MTARSATFPAAADAVGAAVAIQQAVHHHNRTSSDDKSFAIRIGVSIGDVTTFEGDVLGTPVVEASRLCAAAAGAEILAAELVRMLARGRGGFAFEAVGELELKGLPDPVPACRVVWEPLTVSEARGEGMPMPALLLGAPTIGYVGRTALLAELDAALHAAVGGGCRTVLLAGEPGIGKTRTAAEAARRAHDDGSIVLYGRCDEDLAVPYQPFVETLDFYTRECGAPELGRLPGELVRLIPDLGRRVADLPDAASSDPRSEEHRLFEAVASWLITASADSGLVLVLDDLHWAAQSTLQLLVHLIRGATAEGAGGRLLLIGTYRDTDIDRKHALSRVLADLRRLPGVERVAVDGLDADEVEAFAVETAGHELDEGLRRLAAEVHAETEGNPFFVGEVLRHLVETGVLRRQDDRWIAADGHTVDVPEGVRDVVGRRVGRLSPAANSALSAAAVIGREVTLDVVSAVTDLDDEALLDAVDEGVRARLLEETGVDEYRFSHALVRATLYEELSATRQTATASQGGRGAREAAPRRCRRAGPPRS